MESYLNSLNPFENTFTFTLHPRECWKRVFRLYGLFRQWSPWHIFSKHYTFYKHLYSFPAHKSLTIMLLINITEHTSLIWLPHREERCVFSSPQIGYFLCLVDACGPQLYHSHVSRWPHRRLLAFSFYSLCKATLWRHQTSRCWTVGLPPGFGCE